MAKSLVIVESPTKAKTIEKYLGKTFIVTASYGHVRDLPNNAAEIPEKVKKEPWARLGIDVDNNFEPLYVIPDSKKKRVQELKKLLKGADRVYLATDEDREGESISWHLLEVLKPKVPVKRLVFHEITKSAIQHSLENPRDIDLNLIKAQETRRIIDRLFGYSVSPLLWKKMAPRLSAGRVQSVAMRLLVERERERIAFRSAEYWDISGKFSKLKGGGEFEADLIAYQGKRLALGKDFEATTGKLSEKANVLLLNEKECESLKAELLTKDPAVKSLEEKPYTTRPYPPFTTSTLQQEASRKLRFSARHTMSVAQTLYENGFITYMRTDSTTLSNEGLEAARRLIGDVFGSEFLHEEPRVYKTKVRNAQEAHEAIRPSGDTFASLDEVKAKLGAEAFRLYELIWMRTLACQMKDARGKRISLIVAVGDAEFRAAGKTIEFAGFLRAYVEGSDDPEAELADREKVLPVVKEGEKLSVRDLTSLRHETQPPARYTEGSLIKELERLGIGRPSTWATIVDVVLNRQYAFKKGTALVPTFLASAVTNLMEGYFTHLLDYDFTARLEEDLDAIARGERDDRTYLNGFYFGNGFAGLKQLVKQGEETIDPREVCGIPIGKSEDGRDIEVRIGRFGPFLSDGETRASLPDALPPDELGMRQAIELLEAAKRGPESLGSHPDNDEPVYLKTGRFGPYIQLGDPKEGEKPKMVSLLPGMDPSEVTFEVAVKLLTLPRSVGEHPELKDDIIIANGRYGPYVKCGSETRSIPLDSLSPLDMTKEDAIALLKEPKRRGRQGAAPKSLKDLGKHPITEKQLLIKSGRYGPYVTDGEVNASLQKGQLPESLTIEDAVNLLEARRTRLAEQGKLPGAKRAKKATSKKSTKKKEPKTKAATKKAPSKKAAAKKKPAKKSVKTAAAKKPTVNKASNG